MRKVKFVSVFVLLVLSLSIVPVALAGDPTTDTDLPPGMDKDAPKTVERVVGDGTGKALCDAMWWQGTTGIIESMYVHGDHYSRSRDEPNHWYPCDIDKIGVRGRFWTNNDLREDTGLKTTSNTADHQENTSGNFGDNCHDDDIYAQSNHYFEHAGIPTWQPVSGDSC